MALLVVSLAGCGSGKTATTGATAQASRTAVATTPEIPTPSATTSTPAQRAPKPSPKLRRPTVPAAKTLHVVLTATAPPAGSGRATVQVYLTQGEVCWSFGRLAGISDPSGAAIGLGDVGASGQIEFPLGPRYARTGCSTPAITSGGLKTIVTTPGDYFVEVSTGQGTAATQRLRGQLAPGRPVGLAPTD